MKLLGFCILLISVAQNALAFTAVTTRSSNNNDICLSRNKKAVSSLYASISSSSIDTTTIDVEDSTTDKGLLKRDRYIATNRFVVRKDRAAKFEQRWANRKSRLATLPGFRYFHLMRRVNTINDQYDPGGTDESAQENYVSFTIWNKKSDFSNWRNGEAFKEAHGGTSIGAFLSTMVNSALVLRGAPRPAFYDGILMDSVIPKTEQQQELVDGWRNVNADGIHMLDTECYVELIKFYIASEHAADFEKTMQKQKQSLKDAEGFVTRVLMRRDGQAKGYVCGVVLVGAKRVGIDKIHTHLDKLKFLVCSSTDMELNP
jgi:heme-degrading monooxygenase HmoA